MSLEHNLVLIFAAMMAGAVNSVAGGGTLLTFPALLWAGQTAKIANATSTVALWPGQLSSLLGYRRKIGRSHTAILCLGLPSLVGGGIGALLLLRTPASTFARLVPFLILMATVLFALQEPLTRLLRARARRRARQEDSAASEPPPVEEDDNLEAASWRRWAAVMLYQLFVAIYGGYFGAGIGILMLAALGFMGFTNIHRMNGLKNLNGLCINGVAVTLFMANRLVNWHVALMMASGAIVGGYGGSGIAQRIGQRNVRRLVILIGLGLALYLLLQGWR
ncbi:MAG TPA: sulfite exporter TauE/SafE family protein [Chthonomonadaceae bacterium]|nr:sulfite exporter TauE/SafE family protein [Chthonomonadaceae bacterium]